MCASFLQPTAVSFEGIAHIVYNRINNYPMIGDFLLSTIRSQPTYLPIGVGSPILNPLGIVDAMA